MGASIVHPLEPLRANAGFGLRIPPLIGFALYAAACKPVVAVVALAGFSGVVVTGKGRAGYATGVLQVKAFVAGASIGDPTGI